MAVGMDYSKQKSTIPPPLPQSTASGTHASLLGELAMRVHGYLVQITVPSMSVAVSGGKKYIPDLRLTCGTRRFWGAPEPQATKLEGAETSATI